MSDQENKPGFEEPDEEEQALFREMVKEMTQRLRPDLMPKAEEPPPQVGRNDPCPCGSGKKYKRCHGAGQKK